MSQQEIDAVIQTVQENPFPEDIADLRSSFDASAAPLPGDVSVEALTCGGVPCFRVVPQGADASRTILYFHGGGYVFGSFASHGGMVAEIAKAAGTALLFVEYRLAPEHPHPAPQEDALAVYRWLLDRGHAPDRIAFAGDSAGAALSLATALAARDHSLPQPAALGLMSPWADLTSSGESHKTRAEIDPMITPETVAHLSGLFIGDQDRTQPSASPLFGDYKGLAPMLIQVGEREVLFSDSDRVREKAEAAGIDVAFEEWKGMIHLWHLFFPVLTEGREAIAKIGVYLGERTGAAADASPRQGAA